MIYIKKKAASKLLEGGIVDTLNVEDKINNAPSINLVTQMTGIPQEGIIIYEGDEIPEGYEEINEGIDDTPTGTIVDWEEGDEIPEGWEVIETSIPAPDFSQRTRVTLDTSTPYTVDEDAFFQIVGAIEKDTSSDINIQADGKTLFYFWAKTMSTITAPAFPLKKGTVLTVISNVNSTINFFKMPVLKKKQIKKVAVTELPKIEGSIVDGTNIDDKTTNTYSANVINGLVEDSVKIEDISDTGITLLDGFSKGTGFCLYKQGKRIFGDLIIVKSENWSAAATDVQVGTMTYRPKGDGIFTNSQMADAFWAIGVNGYFAIESTSNVIVKTSDVSKKVVKVHIEYVTY